MLSQFQDLLNVYLFPFVIAVPIAIVLYLLVTRREDSSRAKLGSGKPIDDPSEAPTEQFTPHPSELPTVQFSELPTDQFAEPPGVVTAPGATPARVAGVPAPAAAGPTPVAPGGASTLLLVDDSAVARAKLRKLFESAGYGVELAKDGVEALKMLGRGHYDLMITDLEMPNMNGVELIAAVNGSIDTEDMPILAVTGHDDLHAKVHECQGLFGIFKKPWNDRDLLRRVEKLVGARQAAASAGRGLRGVG